MLHQVLFRYFPFNLFFKGTGTSPQSCLLGIQRTSGVLAIARTNGFLSVTCDQTVYLVDYQSNNYVDYQGNTYIEIEPN